MRFIFIVWLLVILFSLSRLGPMLSHGDIGGWVGESIGFALPLFGIYYGVRWAKRKLHDVRQSTLRSAVASYRRQRPTMMPEERKKAAVQMLSVFGTDTPMDAETQNELVAEAFEMLSRTESESPIRPGDCKCGVPNCPGHQISEDGKFEIPNHPLGHLVMTVPKKD